MLFRNLHRAYSPVRSTGFSWKRALERFSICCSRSRQTSGLNSGESGYIIFQSALVALLAEKITCVIALLLIAFVVSGESFAQETTTQPESEPVAKEKKSKPVELLKGNDLSAWKKTNFGGESDVTLKDGVLSLDMGSSMTGVTWKDASKIPTSDYEIELEARRVEGNDFFCGLTFPYNNTHATYIVGGWGGGLCGLSCIDDYDASENETCDFRKFKKGQWYNIRIRVTEGKIDAWIDQFHLVDLKVDGRKISVRTEVELSRPIGICSFETRAEFRNMKLTRLREGDAPSEPK